MIDFSPFHRFVDSFRKICLERTLTSESAVADVNTPPPTHTLPGAFSVCLSLQTEMGDGLVGGWWGVAHCLETIIDSLSLSPHPLWVSYQKKKKKRKSDPILCLKLKQIEDIKDFHFISLKK